MCSLLETNRRIEISANKIRSSQYSQIVMEETATPRYNSETRVGPKKNLIDMEAVTILCYQATDSFFSKLLGGHEDIR